MRLSIALSALAALLAVPAYGFQAFSGNACDGAAGAVVPCDGSCHAFDNRHSFRADPSGNAHCVAFFVGPSCTGQRFNFTGQAGQSLWGRSWSHIHRPTVENLVSAAQRWKAAKSAA